MTLEVTVTGNSKTVVPLSGPAAHSLGSGVDLVSWGANRLDALAATKSGSLAHLWHDADVKPDPGWQPWETLIKTSPGIATSLAASSWAPNRLDVFTIDDSGDLYHAWFDGAWGQSEKLAAGLDPQTSPAAVSWGPRRIDVFARGNDGSLRQVFYHGKWEDVGSIDALVGTPAMGPALSGLGVSSTAKGRLQLFGLFGSGPSSELRRAAYLGDHWETWKSIPLPVSVRVEAGVRAVPDILGTTLIVAGDDGSILASRVDTTAGTITSRWGRIHKDANPIRGIGAASWSAHRLDVVATTNSGQLVHVWTPDDGATLSSEILGP